MNRAFRKQSNEQINIQSQTRHSFQLYLNRHVQTLIHEYLLRCRVCSDDFRTPGRTMSFQFNVYVIKKAVATTKNVSICNLITVVLSNAGNFKEEMCDAPPLPKQRVFWPHFDFLMVLGTKPAAFNMLGKELYHRATSPGLVCLP